jgi:hypothetical protein
MKARYRAGCLMALLVAALLGAGPAAAQQRSLIDPGDAHLRRELRSLENRSGASPGGAQLQLDRAQRELLRQGRGVRFTPEQGRAARQLDRLEAEQRDRRLAPAREPVPVPPTENELPSSVDAHGPLPSMRGGLATAGMLADRAEAALAAGRTRQARSDLATARGFLDGGEGLGDLEARIEDLEARIAAAGG